jgi:hypothetical protein
MVAIQPQPPPSPASRGQSASALSSGALEGRPDTAGGLLLP